MKILIVEDEPQIALGFERILKNQHIFPCHIQISTNGLEAINTSKHFHPNLVITDIRMQSMNGLDMIKELKDKQICTHFIIISGYNRFEYLQTAIRCQVIDYLLKPVDKDQLINLVFKVYQSLPENYANMEERKLPDIPELQFPFINEAYPNTLKKTIDYMLKNYMRDITLRTISDEFMLHVCYLSTLINTHAGITFTYLLNNVRIRKACELLLYEPDLSIDDISYIVGYNNARRLYHAFQQQLSMTPKDFQFKWQK